LQVVLASLMTLTLMTGAQVAEAVQTFEAEWNAVERLNAKAAEAGFEWLETRQLLEQSRETAAAGEWDQALEWLAQARLQAEQAVQQAEREAEAWKRRVLR
jgi:hypothetical protein